MEKSLARPAGDVEKIVHTYGNMLFRLCLITLGNASDAEDVIQETMITYMQKKPEFIDAEHERAWLITVADNKCKDLLRFRTRHPMIDLEQIQEFAAEETDSGILEALMTLPEKFRMVLILYYVEEYRIEEIARMIGKTPSAVKMRLQKGRKLLGKTTAVAASLALCLCITGVTVLAASGHLKGFFRDIKDWRGAVIGTAYEQATEELEVSILDSAEELTVLVTMVKPSVAPYFTFQELGIENYEIQDASGNVVLKGEPTTMAKVADGQAIVSVPANEIGCGTYKLVISAFVGGAKAEQPLVMKGTWEVEFNR